MSKQLIKTLALTCIMAALFATPGFAETFEGTIQGANCFINGINCAEDKKDPLLCMERNFILVTADNEYFFLSNLVRSLTKRCYKQNVKVTGKRNGHAIEVDTLDLETGNEYRCIWDRDEVERLRYGR